MYYVLSVLPTNANLNIRLRKLAEWLIAKMFLTSTKQKLGNMLREGERLSFVLNSVSKEIEVRNKDQQAMVRSTDRTKYTYCV